MILYIADMVMDLRCGKITDLAAVKTTACGNRKGNQKYAGRDTARDIQFIY